MKFHKAPHIYTGEVHLIVQDIKKSLQFYTEIIGFKVLHTASNKVVFTVDEKTPLLIIEQLENSLPKEPRKTGLYHFALLLPTRAHLGLVIEHLVEKKIALGAADHLVSEALYLSDPDGHGIEIYVDRDPSVWQWAEGKVAMSSDQLDGNSIIAESAGQQWTGLPAGTIMGHVHLHVANLKEAETFYHALGFEVVSTYPQALFMANGKYHHHIGLNTWNGEGAEKPTVGSIALQSYTLIYPTEAILKESIDRVEALGNEVQEHSFGFTVEDPAGNRIILRLN